VLFVAGFELIESAGEPAADGRVAKIVHHAVEQTKTFRVPPKRGWSTPSFANWPPRSRRCRRRAAAGVLAEYFSHPSGSCARGSRSSAPTHAQTARMESAARDRLRALARG